jgi:hypothetical protein
MQEYIQIPIYKHDSIGSQPSLKVTKLSISMTNVTKIITAYNIACFLQAFIIVWLVMIPH